MSKTTFLKISFNLIKQVFNLVYEYIKLDQTANDFVTFLWVYTLILFICQMFNNESCKPTFKSFPFLWLIIDLLFVLKNITFR